MNELTREFRQVDTVKTTLQVGGSRALPQLIDRSRAEVRSCCGVARWATATSWGTGRGSPRNLLSENIPTWGAEGELVPKLVRAAALGLGASCVSDCCSGRSA